MGNLRLFVFSFWACTLYGVEKTPMICPSSTAKWQEWIEETSSDLMLLLPTDSRALPRSSRTFSLLLDLARCKAEWAKKNPEAKGEVSACTDRLRRFLVRSNQFKQTSFDDLTNSIQGMLPEQLRGLLQKRSKSLGFNVTDQEYYALVDKQVSIPSDLQDSEFLRNVSNPWQADGLKKAQAYLDNLNQQRLKNKEETIVYFHFDTKLNNIEKSQENNAGRFFIRYPGNPIKFLQFATHATLGGSAQTSVVAVYKDSKGRLNSYIKDHFREIAKDGSVTLKNVTEGVFKGNSCLNCHKSGPRSLEPINWDKLDKASQAKINRVNLEFAQMEGMEWGGFYDAASMDLGPPLGDEIERTIEKRTDSFFKQCTSKAVENAKTYDNEKKNLGEFEKNLPASYRRLRDSMTCMTCHNGVKRGFIKLPFDTTFTFNKVHAGEMPPDNDLNPFERGLLTDCLKAEAFGYFDKANGKDSAGTVATYLRAISCETGVALPNAIPYSVQEKSEGH